MGHAEKQTQETSKIHGGPDCQSHPQPARGPPGCMGLPRSTEVQVCVLPQERYMHATGPTLHSIPRGQSSSVQGTPGEGVPSVGNPKLPREHPLGRVLCFRQGEFGVAWVTHLSRHVIRRRTLLGQSFVLLREPVSSPVLFGDFVSGQVLILCPHRATFHPLPLLCGPGSWPLPGPQALWLLVGSSHGSHPAGGLGKAGVLSPQGLGFCLEATPTAVGTCCLGRGLLCLSQPAGRQPAGLS